jgi:hypothetical protein
MKINRTAEAAPINPSAVEELDNKLEIIEEYFNGFSHAYQMIFMHVFITLRKHKDNSTLKAKDFIEMIYLEWFRLVRKIVDLQSIESASQKISPVQVQKLQCKVIEVIEHINFYRMILTEYDIFHDEISFYKYQIAIAQGKLRVSAKDEKHHDGYVKNINNIPRIADADTHIAVWLKVSEYTSSELSVYECDVVTKFADKILKALSPQNSQFNKHKLQYEEYVLKLKRHLHQLTEPRLEINDLLYDPDEVFELVNDYEKFFIKSLVRPSPSMGYPDTQSLKHFITALVRQASNNSAEDISNILENFKIEILKNLGFLEKIYMNCIITEITRRVFEFSHWSSLKTISDNEFLKLQIQFFKLLNLVITINRKLIKYSYLDTEIKELETLLPGVKDELFKFAEQEKSKFFLKQLRRFYSSAPKNYEQTIDPEYCGDFSADLGYWLYNTHVIAADKSLSITSFNKAIILSVIVKMKPIHDYLVVAVDKRAMYHSKLLSFVTQLQKMKLRTVATPLIINKPEQSKPLVVITTNKSGFFHLKVERFSSILPKLKVGKSQLSTPNPAANPNLEIKRRSSF